MRERLKLFSFVSGHGETLIEPPLETHVNEWLSHVPGEITEITQSESKRDDGGHHVTVCVWYVPHAVEQGDNS